VIIAIRAATRDIGENRGWKFFGCITGKAAGSTRPRAKILPRDVPWFDHESRALRGERRLSVMLFQLFGQVSRSIENTNDQRRAAIGIVNDKVWKAG
jgi:hypothetical protein